MVKKFKIASDWTSDLMMYDLGKKNKNKLEKFFPVEIDIVDLPDLKKSTKDASIYFGNRISENIAKKIPNLEWVHFGSIGIEKLSEDFIRSRKLTVSNSKNTMEDAVASSVLASIFALARGMVLYPELRKEKNFNRKFFDNYKENIDTVFNSNFCILGYGNIAQKLIKVLSRLTKNINVVTRTERRDKNGINFFTYSEKYRALKNCRYLINLLPEHPETIGFVDRALLVKIKEPFFYINFGRYKTHKEEDLMELLESKKISAAALDVFDPSNLKSLLNIRNLIFTPHVASVSKNFWKKEMKLISHNLECYINKDLTSMKNLIFLKGKRL